MSKPQKSAMSLSVFHGRSSESTQTIETANVLGLDKYGGKAKPVVGWHLVLPSLDLVGIEHFRLDGRRYRF